MNKNKFVISFSLILFFASVCLTANNASGQTSPPVTVTSDSNITAPESVVTELYAALSFTKGTSIDRNRVQNFFVPGARMQNVAPPADKSSSQQNYSVENFLDGVAAAKGIVSREEKELWRRVERFGNVAHIFSAYELILVTDAGKNIKRRGINSIQLSFEGSKWRIVSLIWDVERPDNPLPDTKK